MSCAVPLSFSGDESATLTSPGLPSFVPGFAATATAFHAEPSEQDGGVAQPFSGKSSESVKSTSTSVALAGTATVNVALVETFFHSGSAELFSTTVSSLLLETGEGGQRYE